MADAQRKTGSRYVRDRVMNDVPGQSNGESAFLCFTERIREIATIKVLGFYPGETAAYVFRENVVLTAIGAGAGLFMGILLHRFVMAQIAIDMVTFDVRIGLRSYLLSILLTFVFMAVVDVFMYIRLEKIDMAESLKSIE